MLWLILTHATAGAIGVAGGVVLSVVLAKRVVTEATIGREKKGPA